MTLKLIGDLEGLADDVKPEVEAALSAVVNHYLPGADVVLAKAEDVATELETFLASIKAKVDSAGTNPAEQAAAAAPPKAEGQ